MVDFLSDNRLFSVLFLPRRQENQRGVPVPGALIWAMLEETRFYLELQFNENVRIGVRPLRDSLDALLCKYSYNLLEIVFFIIIKSL